MTKTRMWFRGQDTLRQYAPLVLVLGLGIALSITLSSKVRNWEQARLRQQCKRLAESGAETLRRTIHGHLESLSAVEELYAANHTVTREKFRAFVRGIPVRHPDLYAIEWAPRVPLLQREVYEKTARADGYTAFQLTDQAGDGTLMRARDRTEYFPVFYVEPIERHQAILGFDEASDPVRHRTMDAARDAGTPMATPPLKLIHSGQDGPEAPLGIFLYAPIYRIGTPHETPEQRRVNLTGFAVAIVRVDQLVEASLTVLDTASVEIVLSDDTEAGQRQPLYVYRPVTLRSLSRQTTSGPVQSDLQSGLQWGTTFDVAGRTWSIICRPTETFFAVHRSWESWAILITGLLLTVLMVSYLSSIQYRVKERERLIAERTNSLQRTKQMLEQEMAEHQRAEEALFQLAAIVESSNDAVITQNLEGVITSWNVAAGRMYGYSAQEANGRPLAGLISPDQSRELSDRLKRAKAGERIERWEAVHLKKSSEPFQALTTMAPIRDISGTITGICFIVRENVPRARTEHPQSTRSTAESLADSAASQAAKHAKPSAKPNREPINVRSRV